MRQRIKAHTETEICLQIGKTYRVYATGAGQFFDDEKYKDYILEWSDYHKSALFVRSVDNQKHLFSHPFKMVNFGVWIVGGYVYDYDIEGPL